MEIVLWAIKERLELGGVQVTGIWPVEQPASG